MKLFGGKSAPSEDLGIDLPPLLLKTLSSLEVDSIIFLPGEIPIYQSVGIPALNLLRDNKLMSEELLALIRVVRRTNNFHRGIMEVSRGPIGEGKRELKVTVLTLNDDGMILVLISDESEIQRVDTIRRDFVANISHELKTPIGALGLLSEAILEAKDQPEAVVKFATRMQIEAKRLTDLVQEIINLSRLQGVDPLVSASIFDVDDVVRKAVNQVETTSQARNIYVEMGDLSKVSILGDREQLIMAIHNLIENAINYSSAGTRVSVQAKIVDGLVEVAITDQGIGIADVDLERIFERFYRVDPARSRETGGTGLGLSIVKHIALNHGGDVSVWSKLGVGSTFALRLPIVSQNQTEKVAK